jgi:hypothetical protein
VVEVLVTINANEARNEQLILLPKLPNYLNALSWQQRAILAATPPPTFQPPRRGIIIEAG